MASLTDLIVLSGESVGPHPVGVIGVLGATVATLVARVLGEILHNRETPAGTHLSVSVIKIHKYTGNVDTPVVGSQFISLVTRVVTYIMSGKSLDVDPGHPEILAEELARLVLELLDQRRQEAGLGLAQPPS